MVRLDSVGVVDEIKMVSIHAPKYGATSISKIGSPAAPVSIHAPKYGATLFIIITNKMTWVSIHAPKYGATIY